MTTCAETTSTRKGTSVAKYYSFGGRRVAVRRGGMLNYLLADSLGSSAAVLDSSGNLVSSQKYYPFGTTRPAFGDVSGYTDKQFTGQQKEGNLYFMQSRFYDPTLGRFLSADTATPNYQNPQSLNRYSYVLNDPLRYTDPTGHGPCSPTGFGCFAFLSTTKNVDLCFVLGCVYSEKNPPPYPNFAPRNYFELAELNQERQQWTDRYVPKTKSFKVGDVIRAVRHAITSDCANAAVQFAQGAVEVAPIVVTCSPKTVPVVN